jgi:hypothetical protein
MPIPALDYDSQDRNLVPRASAMGVRRAPRDWRSAKQQSVRLSLAVQSILEVWGLGAS